MAATPPMCPMPWIGWSKRYGRGGQIRDLGRGSNGLPEEAGESCGALLILAAAKRLAALSHGLDPTLRSLSDGAHSADGRRFPTLTSVSTASRGIHPAGIPESGEYGSTALRKPSAASAARVVQLHREHPDPGIHGAGRVAVAEVAAGRQPSTEPGNAAGGRGAERGWYVKQARSDHGRRGPSRRVWLGQGAERHRRLIGRNFAIAAKEVSVNFRVFRKDMR